MKIIYLLFGAAFGFCLSRAGATNQDFYAQLFLFENGNRAVEESKE